MHEVINRHDALGIFGFISIAYLVLVYLIIRRTQTLELKLMVLGVVTGLLAAWYGQLGLPGGATVQMGPGQGGVFSGGDVIGLLGRISLVMVLAGIAVAILSRLANPVVSSSREESIREYKN